MWVKRGRRIFAHSFQPAASLKALTHISREIRSHFYKTQLRPTSSGLTPISSGGRVVSSSDCATRPRAREKVRPATPYQSPTLFAHWSLCRGKRAEHRSRAALCHALSCTRWTSPQIAPEHELLSPATASSQASVAEPGRAPACRLERVMHA